MSLEVEPTAVRPRRGRLDRLSVVVMVVVVVVALGIAVVKPWSDQAVVDLPPRTAADGPVDAPTQPVSPSPEPSVTPSASLLALTWSDVAAVAASHDAWGVQTVYRRKTPPWSSDQAVYIEAWSPVTDAADGTRTASVGPAFGPIVLLGVTVPAAVRPAAVQIWRIGSDHRRERVDAGPIDSREGRGSLLFVRRGTGDLRYEAWMAGQYDIEVTVDATTLRIAVQVPDRA